jgi:hypothetical protein
VKPKLTCLVGVLLCTLIACRMTSILQGSKQERAFRERYVDKPFYTAILIQPYRYNDEYLIDLTGKVAEIDTEVLRAPVVIPLGSPITLVGLDDRHILARIPGHAQFFRIRVHTQRGTLDDVAKELALVITQEPPLQFARPEMRPWVERQEVTPGMSRREVSMSWGLPDKINSAPGATGSIEEWIYFHKRVHLFFDNGFVTNWQQF